jgi:hypothetical protein
LLFFAKIPSIRHDWNYPGDCVHFVHPAEQGVALGAENRLALPT